MVKRFKMNTRHSIHTANVLWSIMAPKTFVMVVEECARRWDNKGILSVFVIHMSSKLIVGLKWMTHSFSLSFIRSIGESGLCNVTAAVSTATSCIIAGYIAPSCCHTSSQSSHRPSAASGFRRRLLCERSKDVETSSVDKEQPLITAPIGYCDDNKKYRRDAITYCYLYTMITDNRSFLSKNGYSLRRSKRRRRWSKR